MKSKREKAEEAAKPKTLVQKVRAAPGRVANYSKTFAVETYESFRDLPGHLVEGGQELREWYDRRGLPLAKKGAKRAGAFYDRYSAIAIADAKDINVRVVEPVTSRAADLAKRYLPATLLHYVRCSKDVIAAVFRARATKYKLSTYEEDRPGLTRADIVSAIESDEDIERTAVVVALFLMPFVGYVMPVVYGSLLPGWMPRRYWTEPQSQLYRPQFVIDELAQRERHVPKAVAAMMRRGMMPHLTGPLAGFYEADEPLWSLIRDHGTAEGAAAAPARLRALEGQLDTVLTLDDYNQPLDLLLSAHNVLRRTMRGSTAFYIAASYLPFRVSHRLLARHLYARTMLLREDDRLLRESGAAAEMELDELRDACAVRMLPNDMLAESLRLEKERRRLTGVPKSRAEARAHAEEVVRRAKKEHEEVVAARKTDPSARRPLPEERDELTREAELANVERTQRMHLRKERKALRESLEAWLAVTGGLREMYSPSTLLAAVIFLSNNRPFPEILHKAAAKAANGEPLGKDLDVIRLVS